RKQMQSELKRIQRRVGITFIYVTHDQEEALTMSDRVAVMNGGRIEQCGTPEAIYQRPRSSFGADFVGGAKLISCRVVSVQGESARVRLDAGEEFLARLHGEDKIAVGAEVRLVVRPENIELGSAHGIRGTVEEVVFSGATAKVAVALAGGSR